MEQEEKIKQLKQKVQELEQLKEYRFLTNDIKNSLAHYIQSNEKFQKNSTEELGKIKDLIQNSNTHEEIWWKCNKCPIFIIIYTLLVWFITTSIVDKYYHFDNIKAPVNQVVNLIK